MKLSSKTKYGLEFLVELARNEENGDPVTLKDVADRRTISEKYLWQVVTPLKAEGIVSATPGVKGGYRLTMAPEDISLRNLVEAVEGAVLQMGGVSESPKRPALEAEKEAWDSVSEQFAKALETISLARIVARSRELNADKEWSYCI